ncbi:hypothetical protein GKR56_13530 [Providencia alcalifaciens]|uniref:hypothetical protein n=1 Tax=Providencia alcalifaciens TaxID=126385 RepID=UPI0012B66739|nr:hypothetical protein [Providencia alcalifaciens]MTC54247.1 hypothetical protein [Providencia alcalifaciens]
MSVKDNYLKKKLKLQPHFVLCLLIFILIDLVTISYISNDLIQKANTSNTFYLLSVVIIYALNILFFVLFFRDRVNEIFKAINSMWLLALSIIALVYFSTKGQTFEIMNIIKDLPEGYYFTFLSMACAYSFYKFFNDLFDSKKNEAKDEINNLILKLKKIDSQDNNAKNEVDNIIKIIIIALNNKYNNRQADDYTKIKNLIHLNGIKSQMLAIKNKTKNQEIKNSYIKLMNTNLEDLIKLQNMNIS